jgi:hypothetical protein
MLSEAFTLADKNGVSRGDLLEVINGFFPAPSIQVGVAVGAAVVGWVGWAGWEEREVGKAGRAGRQVAAGVRVWVWVWVWGSRMRGEC